MTFAPVPRALLAFRVSDFGGAPFLIYDQRDPGALDRWRAERMRLSNHSAASSPLAGARVCERVVVFSKRDLVPEWGIEVWKLSA
jgi:hypothetical protein